MRWRPVLSMPVFAMLVFSMVDSVRRVDQVAPR
jgi:hypothetical protein